MPAVGPEPKFPFYGGTNAIGVEAVVLNSGHKHPCPKLAKEASPAQTYLACASRTAGFSGCYGAPNNAQEERTSCIQFTGNSVRTRLTCALSTPRDY